MANCTTIEPNPDVSGIGIRVNLYFTMFLMAIIPEIPGLTTPLREVLVGNAGVSGLSLLITAIDQTVKKRLSLYHAIFIIHLLFFTGIMLAPSGRYQIPKFTILSLEPMVTSIITYGSFILFAGYALSVWAHSPTFGTSPECNDHIQFVLFFKSVRATVGWLRNLWMTGLGITLGILLIVPLVNWLGVRVLGSSSDGPTGRVFEIFKQIFKPLVAIYAVVMLELYADRNQHLLADEEQQWTFGQTFALVQIMSACNELLHFLISLFSKKDAEEDELYPSTEQSDSRGTKSEPLSTPLLTWKRAKSTTSLELQKIKTTKPPPPV